ncbi:tRNA-binding protein [Spiroplasma gladiatoris]|uniref:tRNA-binding protein n=1 Tax=Spiroplasma gladiatoris TaxID=2143 RepID=A0A4V1AQD1_9MOLU|nr:hypothetical protein [Spiroplasma gladiatoris]QBQ08079.1 tRNA-binding protein [Spiroplasma gladiatoris]
MKIFINYNKNFDVLMTLISNKPVNKTISLENKEVLYNDSEIVGINIFNPEIDKNKKYLLEANELKDYVKESLKSIIKIDTLENQFVVAKVEECEPIKNTHLSLCKVNDGNNIIQIVCGAKNVKKGMLTCLATVGAFMPDGKQILKGFLKGYDSFGMLCSKKELNITNDSLNDEGIIELNIDQNKIGKSIWEVI